ncbi:MAG: DUF2723 domain-containing protein [Bacteroidales bacterium]|nr:DUF2723 domain-containing protein [Bacteroidales bacterium]MDT8432741.1 DUF2723 domain-containing protein [Bacteroidales bacterium]
MRNFRFYNLITGWSVFLIAAVTYLLTIEPTTSFWDCGEFIATAYKLEVGHPPGAPFFMILGRFFTLFAGGNELAVAYTMNVLSGLASAFTILFLFWTITHLVRKFYGHSKKYALPELITILGAGALGALAYTFSDTFWFSAVEAEVYATSSLFTAFVFWAMLKWENIADEPYANRWLILIAFVMGISIGTHLLNLLALPALVFIYYFRKYTFSVRGFLTSIGVSVLILAVILEVIILGVPVFASRVELLFVNSFGLPFYSGVIFSMLLLFGLIIFGIYTTRKKGKAIWNTVLLAFFVIMVGYSTYTVIMIRSVANTPLDESNPETIFTLSSYLNREQYGDRPLFHGAYFNARPEAVEEGKSSYYKGDEEYEEIVKDRKYVYNNTFEGFLPRMWSSQANHAEDYIYWGKLKESRLYNVRTDANGQPVVGRMGEMQFDRNSPKDKPTFAENMRFFFRYQVGHMYMRYFMWNFAGRQNDLQGHGELHKGNWISGIKFIDEARLGPQDELPDSIKNNKAHNKYYFLPLIFGLIGMIFHFRRKIEDAWVVALLFILTGLAIVVYLNQYPLQPRERDYAYAGSFYAFSIWIGLGVVGIIEYIRKNVDHAAIPILATAISLVAVPGLMAVENWDDHDRSERYTARAFARNYLNSCDENAIIFTNGDNDTFPLWYVQEVEGFRTDVRVVNLSYLTADWYIEQMMYKFYESEPLPLSMTTRQYRQGTRDYAYLVETATALIRQKYAANREKYDDEVMRLYRSAADLVEASRIPSGFPNDYKAFQALENEMDPFRLYSYLRAFAGDEVAERISIDTEGLQDLIGNMESLIRTIDSDYAPLKDAIDFLASDDPRFRDSRYFIPARKFVLPVDTAGLSDMVKTEAITPYLVDQVRFRLGEEVIYKNAIAQLDMLANNNWERPIYFSNTVSNDNFLGLEQSFVQEGLAYRVAPINIENSSMLGVIDTDRMYQRLVEEFEWGGLDNPDVYMDENNVRMTIKYRYAYATLARALADEGNDEKAVEVLDYCMEHMPHERIPFNFSIVPLIQSYYAAGAVEKALDLTEKMEQVTEQELEYFSKVIRSKPAKAGKMQNDFLQMIRDLNTLSSIARGYGETDTALRLQQKVDGFVPVFEQYYRP